MANVFEVDSQELIEKAAKKLAEGKIIEPPEWAGIVKTGVHKERQPSRNDWWYVRAAAVLRSIYKLGPVGTNKLRTKYGGRKSRGFKPERFKKGSGSVIRKLLQQLEKAEFVKQVEKGVHKGRVLTPKGKSFLDKIAIEVRKPKKNDKVQTQGKEAEASQKGKAN
ncbi:30S ribosomal protein S19e [Nanoarchaeota archaeon]